MTIENANNDDTVGAQGINPLECIHKLKTLLKHRVPKIHSIKSTVRSGIESLNCLFITLRTFRLKRSVRLKMLLKSFNDSLLQPITHV